MTEEQKILNRLTTARREIRKGMERTEGVDLRHGHYVYAAKLCREIKVELDKFDKFLDTRG